MPDGNGWLGHLGVSSTAEGSEVRAFPRRVLIWHSDTFSFCCYFSLLLSGVSVPLWRTGNAKLGKRKKAKQHAHAAASRLRTHTCSGRFGFCNMVRDKVWPFPFVFERGGYPRKVVRANHMAEPEMVSSPPLCFSSLNILPFRNTIANKIQL